MTETMPDAIAVVTLDGNVDIHYAAPDVNIKVQDEYVVAFKQNEQGVVSENAWVDVYREDGPNYQEFGPETFYRVIREYVNRRRNTDKRLGLIGG